MQLMAMTLNFFKSGKFNGYSTGFKIKKPRVQLLAILLSSCGYCAGQTIAMLCSRTDNYRSGGK